MIWAARLGGHLGPLPSGAFFALGGACWAAAVGLLLLSPMWASFPAVPAIEVAAGGVSGLVLILAGVRRRTRERREEKDRQRSSGQRR